MKPLRDSDLEVLAASPRLLVATDFDGTLAPIASSPELVHLPDAVAEAISRLRSTGRVVFAVISGRKLPALRALVPEADVYAGNHGLEISGAVEFHHPGAEASRPLIIEARSALEQVTARWRGSWVEDKELTVKVHYRAVENRFRHELVLALRRYMAPFGTALGMRSGKCALEVHPRINWHKGTALTLIREQLGLTGYPCLCMGDDNTDENMFRALPGETTVHIGATGRTVAKFQLDDPFAVGEALSLLAARMEPDAQLLEAEEGPAARAAG